MVSPPPPPPVEDLCCGPVLIVHGIGLPSEELALRIEQQCQRLRLRTRLRAIDDCSDVELARFSCLVMSLPTLSSPVNVRLILEPFAALAAAYRARWRYGLSSILDGTVESIDAGVVQLFGEEALLHNPTMRTAYKKACFVQITDNDPAIDLLLPYRDRTVAAHRSTPWEGAGDVAAELIEQAWRDVESWGATDIATVPALLACIERCRGHFENPNLSALYRPDTRHRGNRLDILLDRPDLVQETPKAQKTWGENGARVFRHVRDELRNVVAGFERPGKPEAAGAQRDLRRLYESLKLLDAYQRSST